MDVLYSKTEQLLIEFKRNPHSEDIVIGITELFREMRNVCSVMYANMDYQCGIVYFADGAILQNVIDIISNIPVVSPQTETLEKCFAIGMQLIGNLVVGNIKNQEIILMKYSFFLRNMFAYEGAKNYIYMIYYNCYFGSPHLEQLIIAHNGAMTELMNPSLNSEFAEFFIELFLDRCNYFEAFYESVSAQKRPCLLNMIRQRYLPSREKKFSPSFVNFLPNKFKSFNHDLLLQSFKSRKQTTAKEAAAVLDLLSNFSADDNYLKTYQQDISLFQTTVDLFLIIHHAEERRNIGMNDIFSKPNSEGFRLGPNTFHGDIQKNPDYIFKANLVRLISNLSWHNPNLDNKQVEAKNLIPALVECCRIDPCNPFISEWSVFAIRNLRENHANNMRQVEMLRRQGAISKQMVKQLNKPVSTSNYRFCVPGYREPADSGIPIELFDMSRNETKRYLRSYFAGGDPELLASISFSSDSSSDNEAKKQAKNCRKRRKAKKEYHKYSSSSSSSMSTNASDDDDNDDGAVVVDVVEDEDTNVVGATNAAPATAVAAAAGTSATGSVGREHESPDGGETSAKDAKVGLANVSPADGEDECSGMVANMNLSGSGGGGSDNNASSGYSRDGGEYSFARGNVERDKQTRR